MIEGWNIEPGSTYEVEGDLLLGLIESYYRARLAQAHGHLLVPDLQFDLELLQRDVNGRQQFWHRQVELAGDPKRA